MTARPVIPAAEAIDPNILGDIRRASRATNVDFKYLVATAAQESSFNPDAKATTSSATGLYQFLDTTWMQAVKQYGAKYGLGNLAAQITTGADGQLTVADPQVRQQILDLRKDPQVAASLAAEFTRENKDTVERALGRPANSTDLYLAHFLGAAGASQFVKQIESNGDAKAADLLPQAAAANKAVFYDGATGEAKSVSQIYRSFAQKLEQQVDKFASAQGVNTDTATEAVAFSDPASSLAELQGTQPLLDAFDIMAQAAQKLIGEGEKLPGDDDDKDDQPYRRTDLLT